MRGVHQVQVPPGHRLPAHPGVGAPVGAVHHRVLHPDPGGGQDTGQDGTKFRSSELERGLEKMNLHFTMQFS